MRYIFLAPLLFFSMFVLAAPFETAAQNAPAIDKILIHKSARKKHRRLGRRYYDSRAFERVGRHRARASA